MTSEEYGAAYKLGLIKTVNFLGGKGVHRDLAYECAQAGWCRGWERLDQLRDPTVLQTWINTIAFNLFRGMIRKKGEEYLDDVHPAKGASLDVLVDYDTVIQAFRPQDRHLVDSLYFEGRTVAELAKCFKISAISVRLRKRRALQYARGNLGI